MEAYQNFKIRCSEAEASSLAYHELPAELLEPLGGLFSKEYENKINRYELYSPEYAICCSMLSIYALGFVSGARAVRERKR